MLWRTFAWNYVWRTVWVSFILFQHCQFWHEYLIDVREKKYTHLYIFFRKKSQRILVILFVYFLSRCMQLYCEEISYVMNIWKLLYETHKYRCALDMGGTFLNKSPTYGCAREDFHSTLPFFILLYYWCSTEVTHLTYDCIKGMK